jgi:hypothetical protein
MWKRQGYKRRKDLRKRSFHLQSLRIQRSNFHLGKSSLPSLQETLAMKMEYAGHLGQTTVGKNVTHRASKSQKVQQLSTNGLQQVQ